MLWLKKPLVIMSLLRQRAIDVSVESTLSARSPAEARDLLVRLTSCFSDDELYEPASHARTGRGTASRPIEVIAKAIASRIARRARTPAACRAVAIGRTAGASCIGRFSASLLAPVVGSPVLSRTLGG